MKKQLLILGIIMISFMDNQSILAQQQCLVIAHRGASGTAPENTLAAAKLGWEQQAYAVEVDIHLSSDNKIVVIHDETTKRTTGVDYRVATTLYAEIAKLDAGSWKDERYAGEKIPLLGEIVDVIPENQKLVVEIKSGKKVVPYLKKAFKKHPKVDQLIFISFNYEAILAAKKAFPDNKSFWLSGSFKKDPETVLDQVKADGLDGMDLNYRIATQEIVELAHERNLEIHVYTVDNLEKAKNIKAMGVNSITTNIPEQVRKAIQNP